MFQITDALSGKWHLLAFAACCSAWSFSSGSFRFFPILIVFAYLLYLLIKNEWVLAAAIFSILLLVAADWLLIQEHGTILRGGQARFAGEIIDLPIIDGNQATFTLRTQRGEPIRVVERIASASVKSKLSTQLVPGLICSVQGTLEKPPLPGNFYAFNYRDYLKQHHVYWQMKTGDEPIRYGLDETLSSRLKRFRQQEVQFVHARFSPESAEMIASLVFGDDQLMDPELSSAYQYFGLVHLLVVSGMHIAVIFGTLFFLLRRIGFVREYTTLLFLVLIPIYVLLTGGEASIVRSGLTACFILLASLSRGHPVRASDVLSLTCLIMVVWDPKVISDLGFQLSFIVTFTLIVAGPGLLAKYKATGVRLFALAITSELAVFPIVIGHFYRLSLMSSFLSIFYVPYLSYIILPMSSLAYLISRLFPGCAAISSYLLDACLDMPQKLLLFLYRHPEAQLNYGAMTGWLLFFSFVVISASFCLWERTKGLKSLIILCTPLFVIYAAVRISDAIDPTGAVTFINVGQGDSILVQLPHRQGNLLIDTGGTLPYREPRWMQRRKPYEVGRVTLLPELRALRVDSLDALVLTHRDYDHIGAFATLIGQIKIKKIIISQYFDPRTSDKRLFEKAVTDGASLSSMQAGDTLHLGNTAFHVISPLARAPDSNDNSLVIRTRLGGISWLFTGDLSVTGEQAIMNRQMQVKADILKLGHHGSRSATSEEWLTHVRPIIGIVSCGKNNRYGHPHPDVLARLASHGIHVMRTDRSGDLRFEFRGRRLTHVRTAE